MEERRVFLFEQIIIFSKETEKRKNNLSQPGYIFRSSLKVNIVLTFLPHRCVGRDAGRLPSSDCRV